MTVQSARRNRGPIRGHALLAFLIIGLLATVIVYAATTATSTLSISPPSTSSGAKADISSVGATYTGIRGMANMTLGVVLARLTFGDSGDSDNIVIQFLWTDPDEASGLLLSPRAFLETGVYFVDTNGSAAEGGYVPDIPGSSCNTTTQRSFTDGGTVYACPDPDADKNFKVLSVQMAGTVFQPTVDGQSVLYILADIGVPGGAPAGLQTQLTTLDFNVAVN